MHKALVLVAVPLAFELVLLGALGWLLHESDQQAAAAARSKEIIAETNLVIQRFFDVGFAFVAFDAHSEDYLQKTLDDLLSDLPEKLAGLRRLVRGNPAHERICRHVAGEARLAIRWIQDTAYKSKEGEKLNLVEAMQMRTRLNHIVGELDEIIRYEKRQQARNPHGTNQLRLGVVSLLSFGVLSIAIALLLVVVFQRGTTKRLQALMENSVRLGKGQELSPLLEGHDEIARIDQTFHEAAAALSESARKREQLEAIKKRFVAMVSHDLRTPLNAVTSTLELLAANAWGKLNEKGLAKVNMAEASLRQSINLINDLLDLEKMESGTMKIELSTFSLRSLLLQCAGAVLPLADRLSVRISLPQTDCFVRADEMRLARVVVNLLGNSLKFSAPGSTIDVDFEPNDAGVTVSVRDRGPGVPEDQRQQIFEPFQQLDSNTGRAKEGSGLGLAICKAIVDAHGGTIGVESRAGGGSVFWFQLPEVVQAGLSDLPCNSLLAAPAELQMG
jgi:signal transduction histidine kinase